MFELRETRAGVVGCLAATEALDALVVEGALILRVAADEVMLVCEPPAATAVTAAAAEQLRAGDQDGVALDVTDGWRVLSLVGKAASEAFARLSALRLEAGLHTTQGDVARVPAKVVATPEAIHLVVPAMLEAHVRGQVLSVCADLRVEADVEPVEWVTPAVPPAAAPGGAS